MPRSVHGIWLASQTWSVMRVVANTTTIIATIVPVVMINFELQKKAVLAQSFSLSLDPHSFIKRRHQQSLFRLSLMLRSNSFPE